MITVKCSNYECIFSNDNTRLCTLEEIKMVSNHWNRHGVCCNSVKYGDKHDLSYYSPKDYRLEEILDEMKGKE